MINKIATEIWELAGLYPEETLWGYDREQLVQYMAKYIPKTVIKIHTCMIDCGDGSQYVALFKTVAGAELRREYEEKVMGYPCEDAVGQIVVEIDVYGNPSADFDYTHLDKDEEEIFEE